MTTIVYDHKNKQIAFDSRTSAGTHICTDNAKKHFNVGDSLLILAGPLSDIDTFVEEYPSIKTESDASGFCVENNIVYDIAEKSGKLSKSRIHYSDSQGSGYAFAIAAIDNGKTAKEAIKYAMTRDNCTGGKVHVYDIEKEKLI